MARFMRTDLGPHHSHLSPPAVVGQGTVYPPVQGYLFPISDVQTRVRKGVHSKLRPPVVVTTPLPASIAVNLAPRNSVWRRDNQRTVQHNLFPPRVIDLRPQTQYVSVNLAYQSRRPGKTRLGPPAVLATPFTAAAVHVTLAASARQGRAAHGYLGRPVVTFDTVRFTGPTVHLAYSRRGTPKSRLQTPAAAPVVAQVYYGPKTPFVRNRPPAVHSVLRPPVIPPVARPVDVTLAPSRRGKTTYRLKPPTVIDLSPQAYYLTVAVAYSRRGTPKPHLSPPAVVAAVAVVYSGPKVTLAAKVARRSVRSTYVYPIVVFREQALGWVAIQLARIRPPAVRSVLRPPATVTAVVQVYYGPRTQLVRNRPRRTIWLLRPPVIPPVARPVAVTLARIRPRRTLAAVHAPQVVFVAVEIYGPAVELAYSVRKRGVTDLKPPTLIDLSPQVYYLSTTLARIRPRPTTTFLSPPTDLVDQQDLGRVRVTLTRIRPPRTVARIEPPTVVYLAVEVYGPRVTLVRARPFPTTRRLGPPTVLDVRVYTGPSVNLTYSRRGKARAGLAAPAVVFIPEPVLYPVAVTLAYSLRGKPRSLLGRPAVVGAVVYFGPQVNLTYSRRGTPRSALKPPTVVDNRPQTYYLAVSLAYSRRGRPVYRLEPPAVVTVIQVYYGPTVTLAYSRRGAPKSALRPPIIPPLAEPTRVTLAYSRRGVARYALHAPTVIDLRPQTYYLTVWLARNKPQPVTSRLAPSAVTEALPRAERDLRITLAYSVRGKPKSILRKPVVIDLRPQAYYLTTSLAYSVTKRGRTFLRPPSVVARFVAAPVTTSLAYSVRGRPKSRLTPPTVVQEFVERPLKVWLAYSRRGRPVSFLQPPTVIAPVLARAIRVTLAPQRRGTPKPFLNPPTAVRAFVARDITVWLTYSLRGTPRSRLSPPAVVRQFVAPPARTHLVRITHPPVGWTAAPPAVVFIPQPVLQPIQVTLAYSLRGKPVYFATGITLTLFVPDTGDVCGFDIAGSFVCDETSADIGVQGSDEQGSVVQGSDTPESRISGETGAVDEVCGSDEQAL